MTKKPNHHYHMIFPLALWLRLKRFSESEGKVVTKIVVRAVKEYLDYWESMFDGEKK